VAMVTMFNLHKGRAIWALLYNNVLCNS